MPESKASPLHPNFIPVAKPWIMQAEVDEVRDCLFSGRVSCGPRVMEFEHKFAFAHDNNRGVACNSGTTALHLALAALNIGPGQRVAIPTLTMVAVANAVISCGADPVFIDSEDGGGIGNIDVPKAVEACFAQKCSAIILPHLYGHPIEYRESDFPCAVIEDCCEAHYARFANGESVGTRSALSCFSFFGNKIISTGEGGMVLTSEQHLYHRICQLRAHAFSYNEHFNHTEHAFGYRMSDLQAALGIAQHSRRHLILESRRQIAEWYVEHLADFKSLWSPEMPAGGVWWVYPVKVGDSSNRSRDDYRNACHAAGIETRTYFRPLHRQRHLLKFAPQDSLSALANADRHWQRGFYLPLYPEMTEDDVKYIAGVLRSV